MKITENAEFLKKLPSWIYKSLAQIYIDRSFPQHLFIETTSSCNLQCSYCPREKIKNHMDFELFKQLIDEASKFGARSFSLHLFGEPLLYPKIFEAIQYIKYKRQDHTVLLTTNGTLIPRFLEQLISSKVDKVIWSWRPETKFSEEVKKRLKAWGRLTVRLIKETTPKQELDEWIKWPKVEIRNLHNYGGEIDLGLFRKSTEKSTLQEEKKNISKFGARPMDGIRYPCYHLWLAPGVSWNGDLLICCSDPHKKEIIGKFPGMSVSEAWQSGKLNKIRKSHLEGKYEGICEKCDVWKTTPNIFFGHEYKIKSS